MFVAFSRFIVANGMEDEVRDAFRCRPHRVDDADGFLGLEVLNPEDNAAEFWLITRWREKSCWDSWYHSHHYKESHAGIPAGLKLVPQSTEIRLLHPVAD